MSNIKLVGLKDPIPIAQIMYVLGDGNYSNVYLTGGTKILSAMTLKAIQDQSDNLLRINKGTLVNQSFVVAPDLSKSVSRRIETVGMTDGKELSVSRRRWRILLKRKPSFS